MSELEVALIDRTICKRLPLRPLKALRIYENGIVNATSDVVVDRLKRRFANTMQVLVSATKIDTDKGVRRLPEAFSAARRSDQKRLLAAVVDELAALGATAKRDHDSPAYAALERFGTLVQSLVLEGTLQQQFFCKLATRLGFARPVPFPKEIVDLVAVPMIAALSDVIRVGAETTRDSAIEGMGALLELASKEKSPEERFPEHVPINDERIKPKFKEIYERRAKRRRMMVLAVADRAWCRKLLAEVETPIEDILKRVRDKGKITEISDELETELYTRSDLLRIFPAIARQDPNADVEAFVKLLCRAAEPLVPRTDDPPPILIAYARYQESVFRTIDNIMKRDVSWEHFDDVVNRAVRSIPRTLTGQPEVCNAQVRATVSILRTAVHVIRESGTKSKARDAIRPLFQELGEVQPWLNLGIAEGCFRALPELLPQKIYNGGLTKPALDALFQNLGREHAPNDFAAAHRRLVVTSCFRRILISLADRVYEQNLDHNITEAAQRESNVNEDLRRLLHKPDTDHVLAIFQRKGPPPASEEGNVTDIAANVIAGIAHESELRRGSIALFKQWDVLPCVQKVLLTRILALQLHAVSRDAPEVDRYPRLRDVFVGMSTVAMPDEEAMGKVWDLLAALPANAAEAADPDIQRFVEYRGRRKAAESALSEAVADLPGYVLAMISRKTSNRIAGAIAREIELNLLHDRKKNPHSDFAKPLYQVMLRGPDESIFDHLMPRIERETDRDMVDLFRDHVAVVQLSLTRPPEEFVEYLRDHVSTLVGNLMVAGGKTLNELADALAIFERLVSHGIWSSVKDQKLTKFFKALDKLDSGTHSVANGGHRAALAPRYAARLTALETDVKHYMELPVSNFAARSTAIEKAANAAKSVETELSEQEDLQPPEKTLLTGLMGHVRDVFERTHRWYCIEAQRYHDENDKDGFWIVFALDANREAKLEGRLNSLAKSGSEYRRVIETENRIAKLIESSGKEPPRYAGQTQRFEEFAVNWMSSDLDLEALSNALRDRWPLWYKLLFAAMTRPWLTAFIILLPFLLAGGLHWRQEHWIEGIGFWVIAAAIVVAAFVALVRLIGVVIRKKEPRAEERTKHGYWFRCQLPQLAGLIAAPMALIAKFEHSYEFPLSASPFAVALLLLLAFQTTRFFIEREMVDRSAATMELSPRERQKVGKIVGVALAQSFGIAVLLSVIFADGHHKHSHEKREAHERSVEAAIMSVAFSVSDEPTPEPPPAAHVEHDHELHDFMDVLPHQAFLDWCEFKLAGHAPWPWVRKYGHLTFYPTIILSWTALGLFFGLVLEGVGKGEPLRGRLTKENHG